MRIGLTTDDRRVRAAFDRLVGVNTDMTPLMLSIGQILLHSTRERFVSEQDPDGVPWAPLSETTRKRKKRHPDRIGTEYGNLSGLLAVNAGRSFVEIGSPEVYAGTFHFGAARGAYGAMSTGRPIPWGDIPARPFLGFSADDRSGLIGEVNAYLREQWT